ncbi:EAL domain-containing protein [Vibrio aquaticus]|uniref:EAL domain-containing protein n=2 Tax=Vibrio aquaticus TaxID=2496559 RepID=A0A432CZI2_9VIBR|nr:EAL domain-containing protein [Vibrio aquaticus]
MPGSDVTSKAFDTEARDAKSISWRWDTAHHHLSIDHAQCHSLLRAELPQLTGNPLLPCMSYVDQTRLIQMLTQTQPKQDERHFNCCLRLDGGQCCYVELTFHAENYQHVSGTLTPLFFFQASALSIGALFSQLFNNTHHGVLVVDESQHIVVANDYLLSLLKYNNVDLKGQPLSRLQSDKHSPHFYQKIWYHVEQGAHWSGVMLVQNANKRSCPQDVTIQTVTIEEGIFYIITLLDLSDNLYRLADIEHGGIELLTQLPTERQFTRSLTQKKYPESEDKVAMVVAFNPDFKEEDDFDLKSRLSDYLYQNTMTSEVGYLGNNYFVVCVECMRAKGPSQIRMIHQAIRRFFSWVDRQGGVDIHNSIVEGRVGVSVLGQDAHDVKLLVPHAVQAMLEHGNKGRGHIAFYHGALHKQVLRRKELEECAEHLIKASAVDVYYQPIISTDNWDVVKFEALSRFKGSNGQMLNTQEMVSIAEDLDLVSDLDWCVGCRALKDLTYIQERFGDHLGITINRSLNTKLDPNEVLQSADSLVHQYAKNPESVTIELTESAYFDSESQQSSLIRNIRNRGVKVAIDDFGTGYSSFSYLSDSNFDLVKIDKCFVSDLTEGSNNYFIVQMVIQLAHTLNVKVVAEGVETSRELDMVCRLGVDYIQGYYFSKPLPIHELEQAWAYCEKLDAHLADKGRDLQHNILALTQIHLPCLGLSDTIEKASELFNDEQYDLEVIPILDGTKCVGLVTLEDINLHLSPTYATKFETRSDLLSSKKTLNQVVRRTFFSLQLQENVDQVSETLKQGVRPPWVIVNCAGEYLGVVTQEDVLKHFTDS